MTLTLDNTVGRLPRVVLGRRQWHQRLVDQLVPVGSKVLANTVTSAVSASQVKVTNGGPGTTRPGRVVGDPLRSQSEGVARPRLRAGHGWFSIYAGTEHRGRGAVMEGLMLFCDWVFLNTPLRWIYAHSFEHNVAAFASGFRRGESLHLGVLRERVLVDGKLTDVHVIGMERERWLATPVRHRLQALAAPPGARGLTS